MAVMHGWHKTLVDGVGKCSVPMWYGGVPGGFCDEPAFGRSETWRDGLGPRRRDGKYDWYVPALACPRHGGPQAKKTKTGHGDMETMTFEDCLRQATRSQELIEQYDRLRSTNLSARGTPLDLVIDQATGRMPREFEGFARFVFEYLWLPLIIQDVE